MSKSTDRVDRSKSDASPVGGELQIDITIRVLITLEKLEPTAAVDCTCRNAWRQMCGRMLQA